MIPVTDDPDTDGFELEDDLPMHEEAALEGLRPLSGVEIMWCEDYYDGEIDGLARWQGREYWFARVYPIDRWPHRYVLHEISIAELDALWASHRRLEALTGAARHGRPDQRQRAEWKREWASRPDHRGARPVGWFTA